MAPTAAQGVVPDQGVDRISDLPDELLCAVVSSLPAKDGARTMVLSRRWSNLRLSAPLNLDDEHPILSEFVRPHRQVEYLKLLHITRILSAHRGPVRRLRLGSICHTSTTSGDWLRSPALDKLEELHFRYEFMEFGPRQNRLPSSALRFSELRVASYGGCEFPDDLGCVTFLKLRELTLYQLRISDSALPAMISACPALGSLLLVDNNSVRRVRISSPRLVRLGISVIEARRRSSVVMKELIIVNAPSMEKLLLFRIDGGLKNIHVKFAPKLEVLGCLSKGHVEGSKKHAGGGELCGGARGREREADGGELSRGVRIGELRAREAGGVDLSEGGALEDD
ncbi:F-box/FBD/LRR-repeat protein At5g56420-like [Panicum virgatum]|uniref:F-box/FBD/LRR-repeat protein At5g56420-like n=1 Tax=Panicum virgatum TaxID=38727 RepID=UPI0019D6873E|nr:F-box/FBD/LRR-repeat protein At5g56420-like [Panicum virgatum]